MSNPQDFTRRFEDAVAAAGWRRSFTPTQVIDMWKSLIDRSEQGYDDNFDEFMHDLTVRDLIDRLLKDPRLAELPAMNWFRERVSELDDRFRALLRLDVKVRPDEPRWWLNSVLTYAGSELADDWRRIYGVDVDVRS
jgi:hypothetical protein